MPIRWLAMRESSQHITRYAREFFGAEAIGDIVAEGGEIVEPVGERNELVVSHVLRELLLPAVEIADHRVAARDEIPVELELQT